MYFGISTFQIGVRIERRTAVSGTGNINNVGIMLFDEAVQMNVNKVLSRRGSPVTEQPRLNLFRFEWLPQKRIFKQVDLSDTQVVGGSPVAVHLAEHFGRQRTVGLRHCCWTLAIGGDSSRQSRIENKLRG